MSYNGLYTLPSTIEQRAVSLKKYTFFLGILSLLLIIFIGFLFRMEDLGQWKKDEAKAFFNREPLLTTFDGYFYLSLAKDLVEDTYRESDEKRSIPDSPPRPSPPPLISVLAAGIANLTSYSLNWIGALLPAILGPLLAVPLYLMGRHLGGPVTGLITSLFALLYPFYISRSNLGRFDTDCLNVTFIVSFTYLFLRFGIVTSNKRYIYFIASVLIYILFLWWWDQTPAVVTVVTFLPFVVSLLFFYRPHKKEAIIFSSILALMILGAIIIKGPNTFLNLLKTLFQHYLYISKDSGGDFPNIGVTISEQTGISLSRILSHTTIHIFPFFFAIVGFALLLWKNFRHCLFFISLFILSILSFIYADRFVIFFSPVVALGTGYGFSYLWDLRHRFVPLYIISPALLILFIIPLYTRNGESIQWPVVSGLVAEGMDTVQKKTPTDAVVWAWWDQGYALTYLARRATINDGSTHSGERTYYNAIPFSTDSFRFAANFMHFYVKRGVEGVDIFCKATGSTRLECINLIKEILTQGPAKARVIISRTTPKQSGEFKTPEDWLNFFFPTDKRPVYLFLDYRLTKTADWWYWFGTWDIGKQDGVHPAYLPYYNLTHEGNKIAGSHGLEFNKDSGRLRIDNGMVTVSSLVIWKMDNFYEKKYNNTGKYKFEMFEEGQFGALMDDKISETVFNKLFIRHKYPPDYFQPVELFTPFYQIWQVKGDSASDT